MPRGHPHEGVTEAQIPLYRPAVTSVEHVHHVAVYRDANRERPTRADHLVPDKPIAADQNTANDNQRLAADSFIRSGGRS